MRRASGGEQEPVAAGRSACRGRWEKREDLRFVEVERRRKRGSEQRNLAEKSRNTFFDLKSRFPPIGVRSVSQGNRCAERAVVRCWCAPRFVSTAPQISAVPRPRAAGRVRRRGPPHGALRQETAPQHIIHQQAASTPHHALNVHKAAPISPPSPGPADRAATRPLDRHTTTHSHTQPHRNAMIPSVSSFFSTAELGENSRSQQQQQQQHNPFQHHFRVQHQPQTMWSLSMEQRQQPPPQVQFQQPPQQQQVFSAHPWASSSQGHAFCAPAKTPQTQFQSPGVSTFAPLSVSNEAVFAQPFLPHPPQQQQQQPQQQQSWTWPEGSPSKPQTPSAQFQFQFQSQSPLRFVQTDTSHTTTTTRKTKVVTQERLPDGTIRTVTTRKKDVISSVTHQRTCSSASSSS